MHITFAHLKNIFMDNFCGLGYCHNEGYGNGYGYGNGFRNGYECGNGYGDGDVISYESDWDESSYTDSYFYNFQYVEVKDRDLIFE